MLQDLSKQPSAYQLGWAIGALKMIAGIYPMFLDKPHENLTKEDLQNFALNILEELGEKK